MSSSIDRHRCRPHSASSPIPRRQPDDVKWRISTKRSRPSSIRSASYKDLAHDRPAEKWDVDLWRRGKRARKDSNAGESSDEGGNRNRPTGAAFPTLDAPASPSSASGLPCTSAAFQLFPQKQKSRRHASGPRPARLSLGTSPREGDRISSDEARRMRASALGELRRSVQENGEGLVHRMRDWERSRFRAPRSPVSPTAFETPRRSWRRPTSCYGLPQAEAAVAEQSEDEEDDIFIVGETSSFSIARSPAHKKRALSLSVMDIDIPKASPFAGLGDSDRSSSPIDRSSGPSAYSSDDEGHADMDTDLSSSGIFSTPALSHTYSASTNSSLVSLALPARAEGIMSPPSASSTTVVLGNTRSTPPSPTASRSEKAIAALALAIANGAAGLSDYEALRMAEELTTLDESHAGELWN
ncbi:hypothetical protein LXA43DRAFT_981855 [Ganoderma leucocontextum]|nr:hypothetical protein LXA43DRAFT_981855 [Ganoderma leucocontextum]